MHASSCRADVQLGADLRVGPPRGQQPQYREFPASQPIRSRHLGRRRGAGRGGRCPQQDPGPLGEGADLGLQRRVPVGSGRRPAPAR